MQQILKSLQSRRFEFFLMETCVFPIFLKKKHWLIPSPAHSWPVVLCSKSPPKRMQLSLGKERGWNVLYPERMEQREFLPRKFMSFDFFCAIRLCLIHASPGGGKKFAFVSGAESTSLRQENSKKNVSFSLYYPTPPSLLSLPHVNTKG